LHSAAQDQLQYVVIISRHGVRSPTWENSRLNEYSAQPWPEWGVPPGNLTPRGRELIKLMGGYYGQWLKSERLLAGSGCTPARRIFIWADTDQRTIETGRAFGESLIPKCDIRVHSLSEGETDALFSGAGTADSHVALEAVQRRLGPDPQKLLSEHQDALTT